MPLGTTQLVTDIAEIILYNIYLYIGSFNRGYKIEGMYRILVSSMSVAYIVVTMYLVGRNIMATMYLLNRFIRFR